MTRSRYADPRGGRVRGIERNLLKYRSYQMALVLFHAEDLKKMIIDCVRTNDDFWGNKPSSKKRLPVGVKNETKIAFDILETDGLLTKAERTELVKLIDYRNLIAHQLHNLVSDITTDLLQDRGFRSSSKYDYGAVKRLQHFRSLLRERFHAKHYVMSLNFDSFYFRPAEKVFLEEIKNLEKRIKRLAQERDREIRTINASIRSLNKVFNGDLHPHHPLNKYDDGRLTERGTEVCYRFFDRGESALVVAHLMRISLNAARHRQKLWRSIGGQTRKLIDIAKLPERAFYRDSYRR